MAGMYDNVSLQGVLDTVGDNPVAHWMQKKFPDATKWDPVTSAAGAVYDARSAAGAPSGADDPQPTSPPPDAYGAWSGTLPTQQATVMTPQEAGALAVQQNTKDGAQASQSVADAQQKGGNLVPDAGKDPVGHLAQRNQNNAAGVGDATGSLNPAVPDPLTPQQANDAKLDASGKQAAAPMNDVTWWKSNSFNQGLLAFGLNLLSGNSLAQSFAAGSQIFDQHYGTEKREAWKDDLINKGYDPLEVQRYIDTGDNKVLTSPLQRAQAARAQAQKEQMGQYQLQQAGLNVQKSQYEQSPEYLQAQSDKDQIDRDYKNALITQMQNKIQLEQQAAPAKLENLQARTEESKARTDKNNFVMSNMKQVKLANGGNAAISPMTIGGRNIMLNPKSGNPLANSKGQVWVVDPKTMQSMQVAGNPQAAEAANASVQRSLGFINNFDGSGTALFGPTGDVSRSFGDFWGQRTSPDFKSRINTLQQSLHSAALAKVEMESNGNAVREGQLKAEVDALGTLTDKQGQPLEISSKRAAEILQDYRDYLGFIGASSANQLGKSGATEESHNMNNTVGAGTIIKVGNTTLRAKKTGNQYDKDTWEVVN